MAQSKENGGLGFRDLYIFNRAMLSRQVWCSLLDPHSLCARVLNARYFLDGNLLKGTSKPDISYTWRIILKGAHLVKQGII